MPNYFNYLELTTVPEKVTLANGRVCFVKKRKYTGHGLVAWCIVDGKQLVIEGNAAKIRECMGRWEEGENYTRALRGLEAMVGEIENHELQRLNERQPRGLQAVIKRENTFYSED